MTAHRRPLETVTASDGTALAARFHAPRGEGSARGAVLIVPAMGVGQDYYGAFADWLAEQGYAVATFDYRGMGHSRHGSLRGLHADLVDWGSLDCAAALDALAERFPGLPLYWIGHSLGGQILPFCPRHTRLAKAITVATGSGYWRENTWTLRCYVWWLWYFVVPLALPLFGYFPGRRLRKVGDLPRGVMAQWRRWCLDRDYAVGVEGEAVAQSYGAVRFPVLALSMSDDELMTLRGTHNLVNLYANTERRVESITPADLQVRRIGHFGFFRDQFRQSLWPRAAAPLAALGGGVSHAEVSGTTA